MSKNNNKMSKNNSNEYFTSFMVMGLAFGIIFNNLSIGLCLGVAIGLALDYEKKK